MAKRKVQYNAVQALVNQSGGLQQLEADYQASQARMTHAYSRLLPPIRDVIALLIARIEKWIANNPDSKLSAQDVNDFSETRNLQKVTAAEMGDFAALLRNETGILSDNAISIGSTVALTMTQLFAGHNAPLVSKHWQPAPLDALQALINYVDSPAFRTKADTFGENAAQNIIDVLTNGIEMGKGPGATSSILTNWLAVPYVWGQTTAQTAQIYSYRAANHASYLANPDIVQSWMWWADLASACMSCIDQHGSIHSLDETLDDHHNGQCVEVPIVVGSTWQNDVQSGADWFEAQPESFQRGQMSNAMYDAWKAGDVTWGDFSEPYTDDIYGNMLREASLKGILGDGAKQYYKRGA